MALSRKKATKIALDRASDRAADRLKRHHWTHGLDRIPWKNRLMPWDSTRISVLVV
jgi:hypothetical protein